MPYVQYSHDQLSGYQVQCQFLISRKCNYAITDCAKICVNVFIRLFGFRISGTVLSFNSDTGYQVKFQFHIRRKSYHPSILQFLRSHDPFYIVTLYFFGTQYAYLQFTFASYLISITPLYQPDTGYPVQLQSTTV